MKIKLLILFIIMGFTAHAEVIGNDTLSYPKRIMDLPKVVPTDGDRAGKWGLPTTVALRYGLTVDETADERLDDNFAERAALQYLSDLYAEFGDWDLCYYAYLYSPAYVRNMQKRNLSIPQPTPEVKKPAPAKVEEKPAPKKTEEKPAPKKTEEKPKNGQLVNYTVKRGDTLSQIAQKYHVKVSDIQKWNNLKNDFIRENQKLKIYQ